MLLSLLAAQSFYNDVVEKSIHKGISVGLEKSMQIFFCECFFFALMTFYRSFYEKKSDCSRTFRGRKDSLGGFCSLCYGFVLSCSAKKSAYIDCNSCRHNSLLFTAKGHVSGQFIQLVFCILYALVSLGFKYYGEAITYMGMTFPSDLFAAIVWLKNPSKKGKTEVRMAHLTPKKSAVAILASTAASFIFYFILKKLNTANLEISTVSVFTSMMASVLTIMRVPYYALAYAANDIVLIIMWIMASLENPVYVPMIFNFAVFLVNDLYGFFSWKKLRRLQEENQD